MSTVTDPAAPLAGLRRPALPRDLALRLAATEYERFTRLLGDLTGTEWALPVPDCPGWDVRALAGHVLGSVRMATSLRSLLWQNARSTLVGGGVDSLTALQIREQAGLSADEVVRGLIAGWPDAVRGRRRLAGSIGRLPVPVRQVVGDARETWTFAFLLDVVLTRDTWMHRLDVCRALGREPDLTADSDGVLVDDVVREWAARHGRPYRLTLTGPAGGTWHSGAAGAVDDLELEAVEFCRLLSGRGAGEGLLAQQVPF